MSDPLSDLARASSDDELLHRLQKVPEDWSPKALDAARTELRARGVEWEEKAEEPTPRTPLWTKLVYLGLGLAASQTPTPPLVPGGGPGVRAAARLFEAPDWGRSEVLGARTSR